MRQTRRVDRLLERRDTVFNNVGSFVAFDTEMILGLFLEKEENINRLYRAQDYEIQ